MKVADTVKKSFFAYPSLYSHNTYEEVKRSVLHHYFIVLGSGIEWARTKTTKEGGYLTEPDYSNRGRKHDPAYGTITIDIDIEPYIKADQIWKLIHINHPRTKENYKMLSNIFKGDDRYLMLVGEYKKPLGKTIFLETDFDQVPAKTLMPGQEYSSAFEFALKKVKKEPFPDSPYPNFQKGFSHFWNGKPRKIQEDWRIEAVNHFMYWKEYFLDKERVKNYSHYPNKVFKNSDFKTTIKRLLEEGKTMKEICKNYSFPNQFNVDDEESFQNALMERWEKNRQENIKFIEETVTRLNRY